jgi:FkbM family methyltransferase
MKSGATESSFHYLSQYYTIPNNVEISRNAEELIKSSKPIKILWAHDNCDQPIHYRLPELSQHLSAIVCLSHWEKEQFIKYNRAPAEKLTVAYYGLDPMFVPPSQPKSKTAIFFSAPHKGITPLPKIWKQVLKNHPDAKLKVFSSMSLYENAGNYQEETTEFLEAIEELKSLPNVLYSPCIEREELVSHIQDAAFFVHPNVWEETFCLSLAEAMACGCYPIVSDIGALKEVSFGRGKYIPMTGESTLTGWKPDPRFINEFAQELSRAFEFFDKEPETFYQATNDLSVLTRETYDWKKSAILWEQIVKAISSKPIYNDEWISNKVNQENEYEIDTFSPNDIVLDIGAHKGYFTKLCMDNGCKQVHSFEPEPKNFEGLMNNLKDYKNFQPYNLAVFDKIREKEFHIVPGENTGLHSFYQKGIATKVKTVGLDDILINFPKVKLIKIDAEGSEYEILMKSKLLFKVSQIVGEYHDNLTDKTHKDLFEYLENKNFTIKKIKPHNQTSGVFFAIQNTNK